MMPRFVLLLLIPLMSLACSTPSEAEPPESEVLATDVSEAPAIDSENADDQTSADESPSTEPATEEPVADSPAEKDVPAVSVVYGDLKDVEKFIQKQEGKVVVVDTWSTWCLACLREFPHLVALQKQFPEEVVCVSLNINYEGFEDEPPISYEEQVLEQLRKFESTLTNYICTQESEKVYETLEFDSLPAVFVYDKAGKLVKRFDNSEVDSPGDEFTYEKDIIPQVKALLKTK